MELYMELSFKLSKTRFYTFTLIDAFYRKLGILKHRRGTLYLRVVTMEVKIHAVSEG